jgi:quercetin dioxygenase-like cupin family protein
LLGDFLWNVIVLAGSAEKSGEETMLWKLWSAASFVVMAVVLARAQDPTKVEATHYKLAFENEYVQVINVHYGPHEKSGLHAHPGGVVVVLTEGHLRFTDEQGKTHEVFAKPGESRWYPAFKHRVENLGDTSYNAVYIAVKTHPAKDHAGMQGATELDEQTRKFVTEAILAARQ